MSTRNRLPPLGPITDSNSTNTNSKTNSSSGNVKQQEQDESTSNSLNPRQRRRLRLQSRTSSQGSESNNHDNNVQRPGVDNSGFAPDDTMNTTQDSQKSTRPRRTRRKLTIRQEDIIEENKPPKPTKKRVRRSSARSTAGGFRSNATILQGLEEDVIEMDEDLRDPNEPNDTAEEKEQFASDLSQRELINHTRRVESVPTDKFYLELDKKFAMQNKNQYEKRQEERMRQLRELELKRQMKEELKFQISTPRTALKTHKFLRVLFLLVNGINAGFLIWQSVAIYFINATDFELKFNATGFSADLPLVVLYQNLAMPIQCLSYFFLAICIVDCMDRVDFTKMTVQYFVKCISFQNQFWAIVSYLIAIVASLSMIFIDETIYTELFLDKSETFLFNNTAILSGINANIQVWKSMNIVKAAFSLFAWFLFCILINHDKTYESLEKRDFNLLDDLANLPNKVENMPAADVDVNKKNPTDQIQSIA